MRDDLGSSEQKIKNIMVRIRKNKFMLLVVFGVVALIAIIAIIVHFAKKQWICSASIKMVFIDIYLSATIIYNFCKYDIYKYVS